MTGTATPFDRKQRTQRSAMPAHPTDSQTWVVGPAIRERQDHPERSAVGELGSIAAQKDMSVVWSRARLGESSMRFVLVGVDSSRNDVRSLKPPPDLGMPRAFTQRSEDQS